MASTHYSTDEKFATKAWKSAKLRGPTFKREARVHMTSSKRYKKALMLPGKLFWPTEYSIVPDAISAKQKLTETWDLAEVREALTAQLGRDGPKVISEVLGQCMVRVASIHEAKKVITLGHVALHRGNGSGRPETIFGLWDNGVTRSAEALRNDFTGNGPSSDITKHVVNGFGGTIELVSGEERLTIVGDDQYQVIEQKTPDVIGNFFAIRLPHIDPMV